MTFAYFLDYFWRCLVSYMLGLYLVERLQRRRARLREERRAARLNRGVR